MEPWCAPTFTRTRQNHCRRDCLHRRRRLPLSTAAAAFFVHRCDTVIVYHRPLQLQLSSPSSSLLSSSSTITVIIHHSCHCCHRCPWHRLQLHCAPMSIAITLVDCYLCRCHHPCQLTITVAVVVVLNDIVIIATKTHKHPRPCQNKEADALANPCLPAQ